MPSLLQDEFAMIPCGVPGVTQGREWAAAGLLPGRVLNGYHHVEFENLFSAPFCAI